MNDKKIKLVTEGIILVTSILKTLVQYRGQQTRKKGREKCIK